MIVTVKRPIRQSIIGETFADITSAPLLSQSWGEEGLRLEFAADLSAAEQARVQLRCLTLSAGAEALMVPAWQALQGNEDFLALTAPTAAQLAAQVKALTRQVNALIRVALSTS